MNIGEWLQLAAWDINAFFGDDDSASHAAALRAVNSKATPEDRLIYTTIESQKVEFGGILGTIRGIGKSAVTGLDGLLKSLSFVLRFFPVILIVGFLCYLIFVAKVFQVKVDS